MNVVEVESRDGRYLSHSHVSITVPPGDGHYGEDGNYAVCTAYADDDERLQACQSDASRTVYGENQLRGEDGLYEGHLVRRTSYNLLYDVMLERIVCFIELSC
jgi:hypothetical protein